MFLHDVLRLNGRKRADRPALAMDDRVVTFRELRDAAWQLANALRELARPEDNIGILAENVPEYVECYYGVPAAGMALTLLNYRLHPMEWAWILNNADARVLIVQAKFLPHIEPLLAEAAPSVEHIVIIEDGTTSASQHSRYSGFVEGASADEPPRDFDDDRTAWLVYTSGTTGFPKGAMLSHRNLTTALIGSVVEEGHQPDDVNLLAMPLCHIAGYNVPLTHFRGGTVVMTPSFDPEEWMRLVDEHHVTRSSLAPTMLNMILAHPTLEDRSLTSLRGIGYGASSTPVDLLRRAMTRFGPILYAGFGMTELGGTLLTLSKSLHQRAFDGDTHLLASCGRPTCVADIMIVDEDMNECSPGQIGEIVVRGEQVCKGYFRNPDATADAFRGGWFHTGDLARQDDEGLVYVVDRAKDMIITGGENVYSREVEEVLHAHPGVSEAAVIGVPDPEWGERVVAIVVLREGWTVTEEELITTSRNHLASFKKPKEVHFIGEMPKTVSGKILKRVLRERWLDAAAEADAPPDAVTDGWARSVAVPHR